MLLLTKDALTNYSLQKIARDFKMKVEFIYIESIFKLRARQYTHK